MKKALITGVTGQDGAYLADFLLKKGTKYLAHIEERLLQISGVFNHLEFFQKFILFHQIY